MITVNLISTRLDLPFPFGPPHTLPYKQNLIDEAAHADGKLRAASELPHSPAIGPDDPGLHLVQKTNFLPLEWLLSRAGKVLLNEEVELPEPTTERILARLVQLAARAHDVDIRLSDDYRQAFVIVSLAERGNPIPFVESSYICYGLHPDKLWPAIVARRKADLGKEYSRWYDENDNLRLGDLFSAPRKPVQSTPQVKKEGVA